MYRDIQLIGVKASEDTICSAVKSIKIHFVLILRKQVEKLKITSRNEIIRKQNKYDSRTGVVGVKIWDRQTDIYTVVLMKLLWQQKIVFLLCGSRATYHRLVPIYYLLIIVVTDQLNLNSS